MPPSSEAAIVLPVHLHARPAGALVRTAARFTSAVELTYGDRTVNARGVLAVLGLGATAGTTVVIRATGDDADAAVAAVADVLGTAE
jgi:phosphotransferase system HPr (HPr) family protein